MSEIASSGERRKIRWRILRSNLVYVAFAAVWVGLLGANLVLRQQDSPSGSFGNKFLLVVGVTLVAVLGVLAGIAQAQSSLIRRLSHDDRSAFAMPMARANSTQASLAALGYEGRKIGSYFVLAVRQGRIEFWTWTLRNEPLFTLDVGDAVGVDLSLARFGWGQAVAAISVVVRRPSNLPEGPQAADDLWVQMIPTHSGIFSTMPRYGIRGVEQSAQEVQQAVEVSSGSELDDVTWVL